MLRSFGFVSSLQRRFKSLVPGVGKNGANLSVLKPVSPLSESLDGRCVENGLIVTIFGASGFIGRYVANRFGRIGSKMIIPHRGDGLEVRHIRVMGDVGHIAMVKYDVRDRNSISKAIGPSNIVINLVGQTRETINYSYNDSNVVAAKLIAECAKEAGVERLIHFSALGASENSPSDFFKTKFQGEKAVMKAFPDATILRPAPVFGPEDRLLLRYASIIHYSDSIPLLQRAQRLQPVWVGDVSAAVMASVLDHNTKGQMYELGGPDIMTDHSIAGLVCQALSEGDIRTPMEDDDFKSQLARKQFSPNWRKWWPADLYDQMQSDLIVNGNANTFTELGITPSSMNDHFQHCVRTEERGNYDPTELLLATKHLN